MSDAQSKKPLTYPPAHTVDQVDLYFGTQVADPYRWMEDVDSPEVKVWVDAENALTQSYLMQVPARDAMRSRLMQLNQFERYTQPARRGTRYFYTHNEGLQNHNVVFWQEGLAGTSHVLLDPNTLSVDGTVALSSLTVTNDGKLVAYALAEAGSDWVTWHVRDVATGEDLPDKIEWSKFSGASWTHDNAGFFYSAYDAPGRTPTPAELAQSFKSTNYFHKLYFHRLGTPQSADKLVFDRPDDKELLLGGQVTDDGRYLLIYQSKGTSPNSELTVKDLADPDAPPIRMVSSADAAYNVIDNDGAYFWLHTTLDAPKGKVIGIDLAHPERSAWKTLIAESSDSIENVTMVHDTLIVSYLADAQSRVELHTRSGKRIGSLALPAIGTTAGFDGHLTDSETFFTFSNFTTPPTVYRIAFDTRAAAPATTLYRQPRLPFDTTQFETKQVFATSKDGTRVPIFLSYRKGLKLDGTNPTLLYAYGGFNISMVPGFSAGRMLWLEMGGIYAQASLRGGGEYGDAWHLAGTRLQKQNVFDDFVASAEYLIAQRFTTPAKLAIQGASNGGLLVGAVELQRPELFGAVLADVGVMDMLRFDRFTIGWGWKDEYGSPSQSKAEFEAIYRYSPLHNVRSGMRYPPTLITTADHDDRVFPAHSFKFAAAMQAAAREIPPSGTQPAANPILIRIETRAGHGAGMPLAKRVEVTADQFAFLIRQLDIQTDMS